MKKETKSQKFRREMGLNKDNKPASMNDIAEAIRTFAKEKRG